MTKDQQEKYDQLKDWLYYTQIKDWDFTDVRPELRSKIVELMEEEREYLQKLIDEL